MTALGRMEQIGYRPTVLIATGGLVYPALKESGCFSDHTKDEIHVFNGRSSGCAYTRVRWF